MDTITIEIIKIFLVLAVVYVAVTIGSHIAWVQNGGVNSEQVQELR